MLRSTVLFLVFAVFANTLYAQVYIGASIGRSDSGDPEVGSDNGNFVYTIFTSEKFKTTDTGFSVFAGYKFDLGDSAISLEGGWVDFGENTFDGVGYSVWSPDGEIVARAKATATAITFSTIIEKPINNNFSIFGKLGISQWTVDQEFTFTYYDELGNMTGTSSWDDSGDDFDALFGVGISYKWIFLDWSRYKINSSDTDFISLGFKY